MKKIIAIFMIELILLIPIYSSLVFAGIFDYYVYGDDEVESYARDKNDPLTFTVKANIQGDAEIDETQLELMGGAQGTGFPFDDCDPGADYNICTLKKDFSSIYDFCDKGELEYFTVYLYDDYGVRKDQQEIEVYCDNEPPTLISFSIDNGLEISGIYYFSVNDNIVFSYEAKDRACKGDWWCSDYRCAGLMELRIYKDIITSSKLVHTESLPQACDVVNSITIPASEFPDGETVVYARVFDKFEQYGDSTNGITIYVDDTSPEIELESFSITDSKGKEIEYFLPGYVYLHFSVEIEENDLDKNSVEADLSSIGLGSGFKASCGSTVNDITICSWDVLPPYYLESDDFSAEIEVSANDVLGNENSELISLSKSVSEDTKKPKIDGLKITNIQGDDIKGWIPDDPFNALVFVNITDEQTGVDESRVSADLSQLNPDYTEMTPSVWCGGGGATITCRWDMTIDLETVGHVTTSITFNAYDMAENPSIVALPYSFDVDNEGPKATGLYTSQIDSQGNSYLKAQGNIITATFSEDGVGLDNDDVFLDLSDLGLGSQVSATSCEESGLAWVCKWENIDTTRTRGVYDITITTQTKDILGNKMSESYTVTAKMDVTGPQVNYVSITPIAASTQVVPGYIQTGNALYIEASFYEPTELTAVLDISSIIEGADHELPDQVCTQEGSDWFCGWSTDEIDVEGYIVDYIIFNLTDAARNSELHKEPIIVLQPGEVEEDYWDSVIVDYSPLGIDKELVNLYDPFMWFKIKLISKEHKSASERWPVEVKVDNCFGDDAKYLASTFGNLPGISNYNPSQPGSLPYQFYLKYTMERTSPQDDELTIDCQLKIRTLVDGTSISLEETENITVTITYYNNPLGKLDENIQKEIDEVKDSWLVKAEWLDTLESVLNIAKTACAIMDQLRNIQKLLAFAKDGFSNCCSIFPLSAPCCVAAEYQGITVEASKRATREAWFKGLNKWCKLLSCRFGQDNEWGEPNAEVLKKILNWAKFTQGRVETYQGYWGNVDPQHSLFLSAITLCIPGVIYNLQKARVIDCNYVKCLEQTKDGLPLYMCVDQRAYAYCKFVWGEVFQAIPFANVIGQISQNIGRALSHPFEMVGFAIKAACTATCLSPWAKGQTCVACTIAEYLNIALDVLCDLGVGDCEPIWKSLTVDDSVCKEILGEGEDEDGGGFLGIF